MDCGSSRCSKNQSTPGTGNLPLQVACRNSSVRPGLMFQPAQGLRKRISLTLPVRRTFCSVSQTDEHLALRFQMYVPALSIKKEHCHLPRMRVLLVSALYRVPRGLTHLFGNPAIRLRLQLRRTRGFASPDFSGFARSENVFDFQSKRNARRFSNRITAQKKEHCHLPKMECFLCRLYRVPRNKTHLFGNPAIPR